MGINLFKIWSGNCGWYSFALLRDDRQKKSRVHIAHLTSISSTQHLRSNEQRERVMKTIEVKTVSADFSEALEVTRTLYHDVISKTSIVESALACACASKESATCTQVATFIINNLNVKDCFHKRESNKNNVVLQSTILRVRHHVVDTLRTHNKADKLYSYNKATDSVHFEALYRALCQNNVTYRKRVSALIARIKVQYNAKKTVKTVKTAKTVKTVKQAQAQDLLTKKLTVRAAYLTDSERALRRA